MVLHRKGRSNVLHRRGRSNIISNLSIGLNNYYSDLQNVISITTRLLSSQSGNYIEIRNDNDDSTQEFGFVNNTIDQSGIQTFIGANSGYISAIYDQKTNTKIEITDQTQQIQLINVGTWVDFTAKYVLEIPQNTALTVSGIAFVNRMKNLDMVTYVSFKGQKSITGYSSDYVFPVNCSAGLMDFGWTNLSNIFWYLVGGTTSTNARPGATLGAGVSYSFGTNMTAGNIILNDNNTESKFIGNTKDLPGLTNQLTINNCTNIEGEYKYLPRSLSNFDCYNASKLTGQAQDLPVVTLYFDITDAGKLTGNVLYLPRSTTRMAISNQNQLTGVLSDIVSSNFLLASGCSNLSGVYTPRSTSTNVWVNGTNMSAGDTDNTIINCANVITAINGTLKYKNNRTSASDAAVATLLAKGWTLTPV